MWRDPAHPGRKVIIRGNVSVFRDGRRVPGFMVWLDTKHKPKEHFVEDDLLVACAKAAQIIAAPPGKPLKPLL